MLTTAPPVYGVADPAEARLMSGREFLEAIMEAGCRRRRSRGRSRFCSARSATASQCSRARPASIF